MNKLLLLVASAGLGASLVGCRNLSGSALDERPDTNTAREGKISSALGQERQAEAFLLRLKKKVSPRELRDWAERLLETHAGKDIALGNESLPKSLLKIEAPFRPIGVGVFAKGEPVRRHVAITWGSSYQLYGLMAGHTTFAPPDSDFCRKWEAGLFVFASEVFKESRWNGLRPAPELNIVARPSQIELAGHSR